MQFGRSKKENHQTDAELTFFPFLYVLEQDEKGGFAVFVKLQLLIVFPSGLMWLLQVAVV